jgi:single-strand DNA-binding protein
MTVFGRLGRDAELRTIPSGSKVCSFALAYNYGRKDESGERPTQWVRASLWGQRAESLCQYLVKGTPVVVTLEDPHIREYEKDGKTSATLEGTVLAIEFAGKAPERQAAPAPAPRPAPRAAAQKTNFDEADSDIPF